MVDGCDDRLRLSVDLQLLGRARPIERLAEASCLLLLVEVGLDRLVSVEALFPGELFFVDELQAILSPVSELKGRLERELSHALSHEANSHVVGNCGVVEGKVTDLLGLLLEYLNTTPQKV